MKLIKYLYITIFIFIEYFCTNTQPIEDKNSIFVNLNKEKSISIYDLFSKIEIIPMENIDEAVIGEPIHEMRVSNEEFYFLSGKEQVILHFDKNGRFINKINHYGTGPEEYAALSDFRFNRFNNNLEILCSMGYINIYDHSGRIFKKRISFDKNEVSAIHNFIELSLDKYLLFSKSRKGNKLMWYDTTKKSIIAENYDLPRFLFFHTPYHHTFTPFYLYNDTVHFVQGYNGEVFTADSIGNFKVKYNFNFGEYNFDISNLKDKDVKYYITHAHTIGTKYANRFIAYGENSKYYISRFSFNKRLCHLLLDKKKGNSFYFNRLKEDCLCFPLYMDEYALYFIANPQELNMAINPEILPIKEREKFNAVSLMDNPIVVKYTFK